MYKAIKQIVKSARDIQALSENRSPDQHPIGTKQSVGDPKDYAVFGSAQATTVLLS